MADHDDSFAAPVRAYLDRSVDASRRLDLHLAGGRDDALWDHAGAEGWFALLAPTDDDGLGLGPEALAPVLQSMGERLVGGTLTEQLLVPGLLLASAPQMPADARACLSSALTGSTRIALVDPRAAMSPLGRPSTATLAGRRLEGVVDLVRLGAEADELLVVASGDAGTSIVLIDADRAGVVRSARTSTDPLATFARIELADVVLDEADLINSGDGAADLAASLQAWIRILSACELAGIARHLLEISVRYVLDRQQFGKAVGSFQSVKHLAASSAQRVILLENFCAAVSLDSPRQTTTDLALAAAALKANATEMARLVAEDALQMHGGVGFTHEHELHWYYKRVLALGSWYGDERSLSVEVGRAVIDRAV